MENNNAAQKDAAQTIKSSMDQLETLRTAELQNAGNLLQQKQQHLQLERQRLAAKYGEQYPDVQQIDARLQFEEERIKIVKTETERSAVKTGPYEVTTWRVNGLVLDKTGKGIEGITVYLVNENKQPLDDVPHTCSDAQGYYAITLNKVMIERLKGKPLLLAASLTEDQKRIITSEPLEPNIGTIDYRDIVFKNKSCENPTSNKMDES